MDAFGAQLEYPRIKAEAVAFLVYANKELMTPLAVDHEDANRLKELMRDLDPEINVEILGVHELTPAPSGEGDGPLPAVPLAGNYRTATLVTTLRAHLIESDDGGLTWKLKGAACSH